MGGWWRGLEKLIREASPSYEDEKPIIKNINIRGFGLSTVSQLVAGRFFRCGTWSSRDHL